MAAIFVAILYATLFVQSITPFWFNPRFTTDDALQQVYQFHRAIYPELFSADFPTTLMERYLTPLHYWFGWALTHLTHEPVMTAHWMTLVQLVLSWTGMFLLVRGATCSTTAGLLAATWLLHSRPVIQRLTGGLVRGWALPLFCFYLWAAITRRYRLCLAILLVGCFLHPPATFLCAATHGIILLAQLIHRRFIHRQVLHEGGVRPLSRRFLAFVLFAPVLAVSALMVTRMPDSIGTMVTLEQAAQTPEMIRPHGRFAFYPLEPITAELRAFCFQVFLSRFYDASDTARLVIPWVVVTILLLLLCHDLRAFLRRAAPLVSGEIWGFGLAAAVVYLLSREFAFLLYVPNRHLQLPAAVFTIAAFSIAVSRLWHADALRDESSSQLNRSPFGARRKAALLLAATLTGCVWFGSGLGLDRDMNFNFTADRRGEVYGWARASTPLMSDFAGEPTIVDPMPLFGARAVFISTETAHPFYDRYLAETRRRLELSLRAHYGSSLAPLLALADEGVDFFVFDRNRFRNLDQATYGPPFTGLVRGLVEEGNQVFFEFRARAATDTALVPFSDRRTLVVDLQELVRRGGMLDAGPVKE